MANREINKETDAVVVADGANGGVHIFGKTGGNIEAESGGTGAEGDFGGLSEPAAL